MLAKVRCVHNPDFDGGFPANRPARITVTLANGQAIARERRFPRGDPHTPLTDDDIAAKFKRLSGSMLSSHRRQQAIETALGFRNHTVAELMATCTPEEA